MLATKHATEVDGSSTSSCKKYFHMPLGSTDRTLVVRRRSRRKIIIQPMWGTMTGGQRGIHWGEQII
jgi:hypothetical protein